jgi:hypothetical protein
MNKVQEDTLNMYETVSDVLHTHDAVWNTNVPFTDAVTALDDNIDTIGNLRDQQDEDTTGVTEDKGEKRKTLEDQTFAIGSAIVFYASVNNNRELKKKVDFPRSTLERARDNELPGMSSQVHQEAVAHAADILPFGITAGMITNLGTALADYVDYISKPRAAKSETSAATEQLPQAFTDTDKVLEERLDKGMELYKTTNADFYLQYFNARVIVNSPTQKRALEVQFQDGATGNPLEHVKVLVDGSINRRSSEKGNIRVQSLSEGGHSLTASLPGFVTHPENFNVISGETTRIVIRMVRE